MVNYLCNSKLQYYESDTNQLCRKAGLSPDVTIPLWFNFQFAGAFIFFTYVLLCRLLLDNVTLETSGDYRCQVTKKIYLDFQIKIDAKNKKILKIELMWGERKIFKIWMELGKSHTIKCFSLEVFCSTQLRAVIASFRWNIGVFFLDEVGN